MYLNHKSQWKLQFLKLNFQKFCITSPFIANLLTVISDRIARVFNTFCSTQTVVLDISKAFYRVWRAGLLFKFRVYENVFNLIKSFPSGDKDF